MLSFLAPCSHMFFSPVLHCDHVLGNREHMCILFVHLFVYRVCVISVFCVCSSIWCRGLAAACDYDTPLTFHLDRVKRIWYLSPMRAAKVQASLRIRAVLPELPLLAHKSNKSRGTFRQKTRSLAPLNGWACAVKICHDGMLEDTNSLDGAHLTLSMKQSLAWSSRSNT